MEQQLVRANERIAELEVRAFCYIPSMVCWYGVHCNDGVQTILAMWKPFSISMVSGCYVHKCRRLSKSAALNLLYIVATITNNYVLKVLNY